ncbi:hypothetical protein BMR1_02g03145 [Babesia microti strain RI]|uniref:Secreted protein n=1 Tax=Babesia microti (strain RI) TaxID=1133968 RepID=I7J6H1_BABMR|nr:hypothetical protein BMR1_02g03145 [Babesia microti strain RI]CCF73782.1 hypothetical protein BMR1_02g03145 [Babesia microti strain RI]|eukprot:XP_012648391.1 hypothetical protein BMR1_02g03145 [Babesia microti strain RI]
MWTTSFLNIIKYLCLLLLSEINLVESSLSPSSAICAVAEYPNVNRSCTRFSGVVFPNGAGVTWYRSKSPLNLIGKHFSYRVFMANPKNVLSFARNRRLVRVENSKVKPVPIITRLLQNIPTIT